MGRWILKYKGHASVTVVITYVVVCIHNKTEIDDFCPTYCLPLEVSQCHMHWHVLDFSSQDERLDQYSPEQLKGSVCRCV